MVRGRFNTNWWHRVRYSVWAPIYDSLARILIRGRRRALEIAQLRPGEKVLIVGAGTGLDLEFLSHDLEISAIDITPAMLNRLRNRAQRLGLRVNARIMDGHQLEFPDASFDAVLLHLIIAVIPDPVRCLTEARRVLRPGGRAVIYDKFVPDNRRPGAWLRLLQPIMSFLGTEMTRQLGPMLAQSGWRAVSRESAGFKGLYLIAVVKPEL